MALSRCLVNLTAEMFPILHASKDGGDTTRPNAIPSHPTAAYDETDRPIAILNV